MMADIYLVGVGGQGIITASRIIGEAAMLAGKGVVLSETNARANDCFLVWHEPCSTDSYDHLESLRESASLPAHRRLSAPRHRPHRLPGRGIMGCG